MDAARIDFRILQTADARLLASVAPEVFDNPVAEPLTSEFLADRRHHIAAALDGDRIIAIATGLHYVHPDKPAELWINEVSVRPSYRRRGIAKNLVRTLLEHARRLGCTQAWVLSETENEPARSLYAALGGHERPVVMVEFDLFDTGDDA
jgi:aminoglycoside 6'-N-acetyltransferase I